MTDHAHNGPTVLPDFLARILAMIVAPRREWPAIADEPTTASELFLSYVAILAGIPGLAIFVYWYLGPLTFGEAARRAVIVYAVAVLLVFAVSRIAYGLAPKFGGLKDRLRAAKLAVYAMIPWLLSCVCLINEDLRIFGLVGLYSVYVFYTGAVALMRLRHGWPAMVYTGAVAVGAVVFTSAIGWHALKLEEKVLDLLEVTAL